MCAMHEPATKGRRRITKSLVDSLQPGEIAWDTDMKGFGVRCQRTSKVFVLKARVGGRQRWFSIGPHGSPWTVETARRRALAILGEIADGGDPAAAREATRVNPSMADLCERFIDEHAREHKKPSSIAADERNIRNHLLPLLGRLNVGDVSRADIDRLKRSVREGRTAVDTKRGPRARVMVKGGPGAANRCVALLSKMFNLAEQWGWRPDGTNPCRHVARYREARTERFLSQDELAGLGDALRRAEEEQRENPFTIGAIRLLLFTGARRDEVLQLRWADVDIERAMLMLPDSKTGAKAIYLSAPALAVLASLPRLQGNPFVICGQKAGSHLVNLEKPWQRIRAIAGLEGVRLHDLRHSYASFGAAGGLSLPMIGKLLGHRATATTERYAHLAADPVRAANEAISERIAAAMNGALADAEIVAFAGAERRGRNRAPTE